MNKRAKANLAATEAAKGALDSASPEHSAKHQDSIHHSRLPTASRSAVKLADRPHLAAIAGHILRTDRDHCKTLLIISANKGEGKSLVASNIACALAQEAGLRTLLVDANPDTPSLHRVFRVDQSPGMTDYLFRHKDLKEVLHGSDVEHLFLMTLGSVQEGFLSLFNPERIEKMLAVLGKAFGAVVFDGPAIFGPTDPELIAPCFGEVLLVVESGHTRWEVLETAVEQLMDVGAKPAGVILNRRRHYIPQKIYEKMS